MHDDDMPPRDNPPHGEPGHVCEPPQILESDGPQPILRTVATTPGAWRHFRWELTALAAYALMLVGMYAIGGLIAVLPALVCTVPFAGMLLVSVVRAATAHRVGYAMGLQAASVIATQRTPERAMAVLTGACELWDPTPVQVALQLDIDELERHANDGG